MNRKHIICIAVFIVTFTSCKPKKIIEVEAPSQIVNGTTGRLLDSILTPYVDELRVLSRNEAGLAIGITMGDSIIYARTFGYENMAEGKKADFNTKFHIASLSKPFTAASVAKLIQQQKLSLDDLIIDYIPEFKMKGEGYKNITVRHILTHTSGIPRHVSIDDWLNPVYGPKALEENLKFAKDFELDFEPGSEFSYSNSAFDILGIVISRASGMPFTNYVETNVLQPAGMKNSIYKKPKDNLPANWAVPYSFGIETEEWYPYPYTEKGTPSSGLQTTLLDMCQWGLIHLGKGKFQNNEMLNHEHFNLLVTPQYDTTWGDKIGLSWFLQSYLEHPNIMHLGNDSGFEANMYIYPEDDVSIVVMANRDFSNTGRISLAASEILFGSEPKDYTLPAKYKFAESYQSNGIEAAKALWEEMRNDTTDIYYVQDGDVLTAGAILENSKKWREAKEILEYYNTLNDKSSYAWRLLGNANLNLGDTITAKSCYEQTLKINPEYEKGKLALDALKTKE